MSRLASLAKRIIPTLVLLLAVGGALVVATATRAADDCKPDGASCKTNQSCCTGVCTANVCGLRFVDNGDGTITDHHTGLIWEKKDNICPGIHCVNDSYLWSSTGTAPDGGAFTSFLNTLNGGATGVGNCTSGDGSTPTGGFVNHCDWRLPTIAELGTIIDTSASGCGTGSPCIDATFGPTASSFYWSSTTGASFPSFAWSVNFLGGFVFPGNKSIFSFSVRAVRGGS